MELSDLLEAQRLALTGVLCAPSSFLLATPEQLLEHCNGCGAADSWFRPPATIYGTNILAACIIHDWMYGRGIVIDDKFEADGTFRNNMMRLITRDAHLWYKPTSLQRLRALKYYVAVKNYGGEAFWAGKGVV